MGGNLQTIQDIRNYLTEELAGIYSGQEIKSILNFIFSSVLNTGKPYLPADRNKSLLPEQTEKLIRICTELKTGKPVQYVVGETIFYNCRIKVNPGVLIPRPETEELVDMIIKENKVSGGRFLDTGTGSGCIAIALAANIPDSSVTAIDISAKALSTAADNAKLNNVNINFLQVDILNPDYSMLRMADIIVSNPPYIRDSEKKHMHVNILDFEPYDALFVPDDDPLVFYRAILAMAERILIPGGKVYFEINEIMGLPIFGLLESYNYKDVKIFKDINGKERIAKGYKNG